MKKLALLGILLVTDAFSSAVDLEPPHQNRSPLMKLDCLSKISVSKDCGTSSLSPDCTTYNLVSSEAGQPWIVSLYDLAELQTDPHFHRIKTQTYVILDGETTLHTGKVQEVIRAGQIVTIPPHLSHILKQESPIRFLVVEWPNIPHPEDYYEKILEAPNTDVAFVSPLLMTESSINKRQLISSEFSDLKDLPPSAYQNRIDCPSHIVYEMGQDSDHKWSLAIIDVKDVVPHFHKEGAEHFIVLSGELRIELQGVTHMLTPGQSAHIAPGHIHHLRSANAQAVRLLCVNFPAFDPGDFHLVE